MTEPNLAEALVALMVENARAERHLDRMAVRTAGGEALSHLFAPAEPEASTAASAPASEPLSASSGASSGSIDWTETDARIEAARKAVESPAPPADGGATTPEERAFLAALNPTGETHP